MTFRGFNKKSNVLVEIIIFFVVLFIVATVWIIASYAQQELNTELQADADLDTQAKQLHQDMTTRTPKVLDAGLLFFFILFWALTLVAAYMQESHPIFFAFSLIIYILVMVVIVALGNGFYELFVEGDYSTMAAVYPLTYFIFNHILEAAIVAGGSILLALHMGRQQ